MPEDHQVTAEALASRYLVALQAKDKAGILSLLANGCELIAPCNVSGTNDLSDSWSSESLATNYDNAFSKIAIIHYVDLEITPSRDGKVAFAEGLGQMMMANGRPYNNRYIFRFDVADGKITRIKEYLNPITSAIAMGFPLPVTEPL
jgi:ketosteroid isomerase-like protein